ncbi:hypothetical protein ABZZ37_16070 [Streptomyces sp. NPDC006464]|uniref:hypothetical protein n=1 Tax=unclassified Streptomyces TaxID=2593676 RepID=UPI0033B43685
MFLDAPHGLRFRDDLLQVLAEQEAFTQELRDLRGIDLQVRISEDRKEAGAAADREDGARVTPSARVNGYA